MGKCGRCLRLTTLPTSCAVVMKSGNLNILEPSGPLQACNVAALPCVTLLFAKQASKRWNRHLELLPRIKVYVLLGSLKCESQAASSSETLVAIYRYMRRQRSEDPHHHQHSPENLRSPMSGCQQSSVIPALTPPRTSLHISADTTNN